MFSQKLIFSLLLPYQCCLEPSGGISLHTQTHLYTFTQINSGSHTKVKLQSQKSPQLQSCLRSIVPFSIHFNLFSFQSPLPRLDGFHRLCFCGGSLDHNKNTHQAKSGSVELVLGTLDFLSKVYLLKVPPSETFCAALQTWHEMPASYFNQLLAIWILSLSIAYI